jgi:hypothetical protein
MNAWLPFVILSIVSWGAYIPTLHRGQLALGGSGIHSFLMVGIAYVLVAIAIPGSIVARAGSWNVFTPHGIGFSMAAGILGSLGALGIVFALTHGGKPSVVPSLVFAGTPIISVFVAMIYDPPKQSPSALFFLGILLAASGASLVLAYRPN